MRGIGRLIAIGVVVVVIGLVVSQMSQSSAGANAEQQSIIQDEILVSQGNLAVTVNATGSVSPVHQVGLAFEFSAPVSEILVQDGQTVQAGDVLARLDTDTLDIALANAKVSLDAQQVAYDALTAPAREVDVAAARAALNVAYAQSGAVNLGPDATQVEIARLQTEIARNQLWQAQLQRDQAYSIPPIVRQRAEAFGQDLPSDYELAAGNVPPELNRADYEVGIADANYAATANEGPDTAGLSAAYAQIAAAQAQLEKLLNGPSETDLQIAEMQLQVARLAVQQAEANVNRAVLTAPFAGVIARNNLVVGEIPPQGAAMELIDTQQFYVDVAVDETDIAGIQTGQTVTLALDALPGADIIGTVTRVAVTPVRVGQLVTYTVRVTLDETREAVRAGMTATATILVSELREVLVLPNRFIRIDRATQQAYVTVERPGGFEDVPVKLGLRNETDSQIVEGIAEGQRVVLLPRATFNPIEGN